MFAPTELSQWVPDVVSLYVMIARKMALSCDTGMSNKRPELFGVLTPSHLFFTCFAVLGSPVYAGMQGAVPQHSVLDS
jgi:hypothetical protein